MDRMAATGYAYRFSELRTASEVPADFREFISPADLPAIQAISDDEVEQYRAALDKQFEHIHPYGI